MTPNSGKHHLVFSISANGKSPACSTMTANLRSGGVDTLFEINSEKTTNNMFSRRKASLRVPTGAFRNDTNEECFERNDNDAFVESSLFWPNSHEMARANCTYHCVTQDGDPRTCELLVSATDMSAKTLLTNFTEKGQRWFFGEHPVHARFYQPGYVPRFADFDSDIEHACVVIGTDIVSEDALRLTGIEYQPSRGGCWKLEPSITYMGTAIGV
jgi:hypothetical protein